VNSNDLMDWLRQIPRQLWLVLALLPIALLWKYRKRLADQRRSSAAENWPIAEGRTWYARVSNASPDGTVQGCNTSFTYSFNLTINGETDYFSGKFSHSFPQEDQAQKWLDSLKEKKIPVRVCPGNPNVSAVLFADLVAKFPVPIPAMLGGGLQDPGVQPKQPYILRWPTEMVASLVAVGFCLGLLDHLYRVLADRPLFPKLAIFLWIGFAVVVIPFEIWFHRISGGFSFSLRNTRKKGPIYLRLLTWSINLYAASNWFISGTHFAQYFHMHRDRVDPMANGAYLAVLLGDYAASLYGRLESIEESPIFSPSSLRPE
jgi:hypothetical protein